MYFKGMPGPTSWFFEIDRALHMCANPLLNLIYRAAFIPVLPDTQWNIFFLNNGSNIRLFITVFKHLQQNSMATRPLLQENCFLFLPVVNWNKILNACVFFFLDYFSNIWKTELSGLFSVHEPELGYITLTTDENTLVSCERTNL